jgi:hypothetical protein
VPGAYETSGTNSVQAHRTRLCPHNPGVRPWPSRHRGTTHLLDTTNPDYLDDTFVTAPDDGNSAPSTDPFGATASGVNGTPDTSSVPLSAAAQASINGAVVTPPTGQLWYVTQGSLTDARLAHINNDNGNPINLVDNSPTTDLQTGFPEDMQIDPAANLYYVLVDGGPPTDTNAQLLVGHLNSTAAPTVVFTVPNNNDIVNAIQLDPFTHHLYLGYEEGINGIENQSGIKDFTYTPIP